MASKKITDLPAATTIAAGDVIPFVSDPSGSPVTKKITRDNFKASIFSAGNQVTGTTQAMAVNAQYIANNASLVTLTLPATAAIGDRIEVLGKGAGLWKIAQNSGQTIHGATNTTAGVSGYVQGATRYDCITLVCITANTDWVVVSQRGTPTFN